MGSLSPAMHMMAFFMQFYKKNKQYVVILALLVMVQALFAPNIIAGTSSLDIKTAELVTADDTYVLNADFEIDFNTQMEEAINKGVPLNFLIEFQLVVPHKYWFDDEIETHSIPLSLSYHALTRQYLVNITQNKQSHQRAFETINEALIELSHLRDWKVLDKNLIEKGVTYKAALLMRLDQKKLPKALQVEALSSEAWDLSSEKFEWMPSLQK